MDDRLKITKPDLSAGAITWRNRATDVKFATYGNPQDQVTGCNFILDLFHESFDADPYLKSLRLAIEIKRDEGLNLLAQQAGLPPKQDMGSRR